MGDAGVEVFGEGVEVAVAAGGGDAGEGFLDFGEFGGNGLVLGGDGGDFGGAEGGVEPGGEGFDGLVFLAFEGEGGEVGGGGVGDGGGGRLDLVLEWSGWEARRLK